MIMALVIEKTPLSIATTVVVLAVLVKVGLWVYENLGASALAAD